MTSEARRDRYILVWERATAHSVDRYTADEFNSEFSQKWRTLLLDGQEVGGYVDLEAYYFRKLEEEYA